MGVDWSSLGLTTPDIDFFVSQDDLSDSLKLYDVSRGSGYITFTENVSKSVGRTIMDISDLTFEIDFTLDGNPYTGNLRRIIELGTPIKSYIIGVDTDLELRIYTNGYFRTTGIYLTVGARIILRVERKNGVENRIYVNDILITTIGDSALNIRRGDRMGICAEGIDAGSGVGISATVYSAKLWSDDSMTTVLHEWDFSPSTGDYLYTTESSLHGIGGMIDDHGKLNTVYDTHYYIGNPSAGDEYGACLCTKLDSGYYKVLYDGDSYNAVWAYTQGTNELTDPLGYFTGLGQAMYLIVEIVSGEPSGNTNRMFALGAATPWLYSLSENYYFFQFRHDLDFIYTRNRMGTANNGTDGDVDRDVPLIFGIDWPTWYVYLNDADNIVINETPAGNYYASKDKFTVVWGTAEYKVISVVAWANVEHDQTTRQAVMDALYEEFLTSAPEPPAPSPPTKGGNESQGEVATQPPAPGLFIFPKGEVAENGPVERAMNKANEVLTNPVLSQKAGQFFATNLTLDINQITIGDTRNTSDYIRTVIGPRIEELKRKGLA